MSRESQGKGFGGLADLVTRLDEEEARNNAESPPVGAGKRGFGGLSGLVSEPDRVQGAQEVAPGAPEKSGAPQERRPPDSQAAKNLGSKTVSAAPAQAPGQARKQAPPPTPKGSTAAKWFWGLVGLGVLIAVLSSGEDDRVGGGGQPVGSGASPPRSAHDSSPARVTPPPPAEVSPPTFEVPAVGYNLLLSAAQIRWCLREEIRIDTERGYANTEAEIDAFNAHVADYNQRCGSFRYRSGALERAQREVDGMRLAIVAEVVGRIRAASVPEPSDRPFTDSRPSSRSTPREGRRDDDEAVGVLGSGRGQSNSNPTDQLRPPPVTSRGEDFGAGVSEPVWHPGPNDGAGLVAAIQRELNRRGYGAGPEDGISGQWTRAAIKAFQRDHGLTADGQPSYELLRTIERAGPKARVPMSWDHEDAVPNGRTTRINASYSRSSAGPAQDAPDRSGRYPVESSGARSVPVDSAPPGVVRREASATTGSSGLIGLSHSEATRISRECMGRTRENDRAGYRACVEAARRAAAAPVNEPRILR